MSESCIVVTGAASGIGAAVTKCLRAQGESVFTVDLKGDVDCVGDLLADNALSLLTTAIKAKFPLVKGFVHAAGFDQMAPLGLIKSDALQRLVAIHAGFPIQFLGWLAKRNNHAENAACVLISSLSAHEGAKGHVAYAAAKGAVEGFLKPAAAELVEKDVRLNAVVLGVVETEMSKAWLNKLLPEQLSKLKDDYPLGLGQVEDVAAAVSFLLSSSARWITGQILICDGGHTLT